MWECTVRVTIRDLDTGDPSVETYMHRSVEPIDLSKSVDNLAATLRGEFWDLIP
jgi:hypothetical protein